MVLITKTNVTSALLEGVHRTNGDVFLLDTPMGVHQFTIATITNSHGNFVHKRGMIILRVQNAYLVFTDDTDTVLHGDVTELVDYIKKGNYAVIPAHCG